MRKRWHMRVGDGAVPLFDILFDTTDSDVNHPVFAHVVFVPDLGPLLAALVSGGVLTLGQHVDAS